MPIIEFVLALGIFCLGFFLGWIHSSNWSAGDKEWEHIRSAKTGENGKYKEYWFWLDASKTRFRITFGSNNAVLCGSVPPSYIGGDSTIIANYLESEYIT